jgi:hypothetical protein
MKGEMTQIESKIEENSDPKHLLVAFNANPFPSDIECEREFICNQQECLERRHRNQPEQST